MQEIKSRCFFSEHSVSCTVFKLLTLLKRTLMPVTLNSPSTRFQHLKL